jgi:hypothetical protein
LAGQYSHKQFFRHIPNVQLENYFTSKNIDLGINLLDLNEKDVESIFQAFTALPEEQQASVEAEFQDIDAMACDGGITTLIDEADFYIDKTFVESIPESRYFCESLFWASQPKQAAKT